MLFLYDRINVKFIWILNLEVHLRNLKTCIRRYKTLTSYFWGYIEVANLLNWRHDFSTNYFSWFVKDSFGVKVNSASPADSISCFFKTDKQWLITLLDLVGLSWYDVFWSNAIIIVSYFFRPTYTSYFWTFAKLCRI